MTVAAPSPSSPEPSRRPMEEGLRQAILRGDLTWVLADTTPRPWKDMQGQTLAVLEVLDRMASVDPKGHTPWLLAALYGRLDALELLESWSDLGACTRQGRDALMLAAGEGHAPVVQALLDRWGADPRRQDRNGGTALMHAAAEGHDRTVEILLPVSDPRAVSHQDGNTALLLAAKHGRTGCVTRLLPVSDVHRPCGITWAPADAGDPWLTQDRGDRDGTTGYRTPLMWAATGGPLAMLDLLIPVSDHARTDAQGRTAFDLSAQGEHWEHLDRLAFHAPADRVARAFDRTPERMPAWAAHLERQALRASLGDASEPSVPSAIPPRPEGARRRL